MMTPSATTERSVDVRRDLDPDEFIHRYVLGNRPVVVTDAIDRWPARTRWNLDYMRSVFGEEPVEVTDDGPHTVARMRFADLVTHIEQAERAEVGDRSISHLRYLRSRDKGPFKRTRGDWSRPYFMPARWYCVPFALRDWDPSRRLCPGFNLYISPRGAASKLHVDGMRTNSVLCQIQGQKRCFLIPPGQEHLLPDRAERARRTASHLTVRRPDFGGAHVLELLLEPGQILMFPRSWHHEVHTVSASISLSWNFVHGIEAPGFYPWYLKALLRDRELLNVG